jgi:hypothetical protein
MIPLRAQILMAFIGLLYLHVATNLLDPNRVMEEVCPSHAADASFFSQCRQCVTHSGKCVNRVSVYVAPWAVFFHVILVIASWFSIFKCLVDGGKEVFRHLLQLEGFRSSFG